MSTSATPDQRAKGHKSLVLPLLAAWRLCKRTLWYAIGILAVGSMVLAQSPNPGPVTLLIQGTGGTVTTPTSGPASGYIVHTFNYTTDNAIQKFVPPPGVTQIEVMIIGGGGGGGSTNNTSGGGGGGGGGRFHEAAVNVTPGNEVDIVVGRGGAGGASGASGVTGLSSSVNNGATTLTAPGGGGGGGGAPAELAGKVGGSGGGGGGSQSSNAAGTGGGTTGAVGSGNPGGAGRAGGNGANRAGGGGGGANTTVATGTGSDSPSNGTGGAGGGGRTSGFFGGTFAGGGGGGGGTNGAGGTGGGGGGGTPNATANTGGGGAGRRNAAGGTGAHGIVVLRYLPATMEIEQQPPTTVESTVSFTTNPANQPRILVIGGNGQPLGGVTVAVADGGGAPTLSGTLTAVSDNTTGLATFTDLTLTGEGSDVLVFTVPGAGSNQLVSNSITVTAPSQNLAISQQPSATAQSGIAFQTPAVILANNGSNMQGVEVTASIQSGGGSLSNDTAITDANGLATFTNLAINGDVGDRVLQFSATGWGAVSSNTISVQAPNLVIQTQPSSSVDPGIAFPQQPSILVQNVYGATVSGVTVTASIASGDGNALLEGTVTAVSNGSGVATFTDLAINGIADDYTLLFSANTWTAVESATITVQPAPPLVVNTQPSSIAQSGLVLAVQPIILANNGNNVSGLEVSVTLVPDNTASLSGNTTATTQSNGLATFSGLTITGDPGDYVLRFTAPGWQLVDSQTITVTVPDLTINTQPSANAFPNIVFDTQPIISVRDVYDNPVQNATVTAAIASGSGNIAGTLTATTNSSGLASFSNLSITDVGMHTLLFSAPGWDDVISATINVQLPPNSCVFDGGVIGSQIVSLLGCTEVQVTGSTVINIAPPIGTSVGDLLVAAFSSNGNGTTVSAPAGWTNTMPSQGHTTGPGGSRQNLSIWTRVFDGTEALPFAFSTNSAQDTYAYLMRYGGASGTILTATPTVGNGASATAPALTTLVDNSLVVRLAAVNGSGNMTANPATIITGHRNITQNVAGASWGAAAYFNLQTAGGTGTANFSNTGGNWVTQTIAIEPSPIQNYFTITHAEVYPLCMPSTQVTVTVRDLQGNIDPDFEGVVTITNSANTGNYSLNTGPGNFNNGTAGNGTATYEFIGADNGVVILDFSDTNATPSLTFDVNSGLISTQDYNLSMNVGQCTFTVSHSGQGGVCAANPVTFTILGPDSSIVTGYTGVVTVTSTPGTGNWSNLFGEPGNFNNGTLNDGIATYEFVAADNGQIRLGYRNSADTYQFSITAGSGNVNGISANDGNMIISACSFRIIHIGSGSSPGPEDIASVCRPEPITMQVVNASGVLVTSYAGTVNISTAGVTGGNWSKTSNPADALGILTPGSPNTGAATYGFSPNDGGEIILNFQNNTAETVNFNLVATSVAQPSGEFDPNLVIQSCRFRIAHSGTSDVCSIEQVTITLVDALAAPVTGYTGTINLSTTTGFGTWVDIGQSQGTLNDPVAKDGNATYQFVSGDGGAVTLGFRHSSNTGPVNIDVSDGVTLDARNPANQHDQNIVISLCAVRISHDLTSNACAITEVEFRVINSLGAVATDYLGTLRISNNTARGDWNKSGTAQGELTAPSGPDTGIADYEFSTGDAGVVVLRFNSQSPALINFNVVDGVIVEDGGFDPSLSYQGCFPTIFAGPVCTNPGTSASVSIPDAHPVAAVRSRMVLMATMQVGDFPDVNNINYGAVFDGKDMSLVYRQSTENTDFNYFATAETWAIFDDDLPEVGGSYTGVFNQATSGTAICLLSVVGIEQALPQAAADPQFADSAPLNGSSYFGPVVNGRHNAVTSISTDVNNAFIFSLTVNDRFSNQGLNLSFYRPPQPASALTGIWGGHVPSPANDPPYRTATLQANPSFGKSAGSAGVLSSAGLIEVIEPYQADDSAEPPTINAHIAAAFRPLVAGEPLATNFAPVILHETYSGAISYRAIGNSLRADPSPATQPATVDPDVDCTFVDFSVGTTAPLEMPPGSSVVSAYLYWAGSGGLNQADNQVTFGLENNGSPGFVPVYTTVLAAEIFLAEGITAAEADFFAGYAEVTPLVTGNGTYRLKDFAVQSGAPWNTNGTCAGGWSLIVVYENDSEHLRVVNLFHGFQPFQYSAFTLVPRNFRMATYNEDLLLPNGQVTHFTLEGDEQIFNGDESLRIQAAPNSTVFNTLPNSFNPEGEEFNSTVTYPLYALGPVRPPLASPYYEFDSTAGLNSDGYNIFRPGADAQAAGRVGRRIGETWGVDVDTHYIGHTTLQNFALPGQEAERITTRYSSGQDMVILVSEVISVTNFPIADLEVFINQSGNFKVGGTGAYQIEVRNNGNGIGADGQATGEIKVAVRLPEGFSFASSAAVGGTGWSCDVALSPGAFTCTYDIAATHSGGELPQGASLPLITANVQLAAPSASPFPLLNNERKIVARLLHSGGSCDATTIGFIPNPENCVRSPQFDNRNDLQGGILDINNLVDKSENNNNVHSINTNVKGIETNLRIVKTVIDGLETNQPGQYLLTVTNLGPDATTFPITVTDEQPTGVTFTGVSNAAGWSCSTISPTLSCVHNASLALNASTTITLDVDVTAGASFNVTNTALVATGTYNFDIVPGNNSSTNITTVVGPPVASQERFLLSVSTLGNSTSIGGLNNFENHDLIIYDPSTDVAVMFFDDSAVNGGRINDINAVHLLKNGHIVISANGSSIIGTNDVAFEPWDLVRYDPIIGTASLFLQGSTVFANHENVNINAVYIMDDCAPTNNHEGCSVLFSTTNGGTAGSNNLTFTSADIVRYYRSGPNAGTAEIYLDGAQDAAFVIDQGQVDIDAFYLRVDPNNASAVIDTFVLSVSNEGVVFIGDGLDPVTGTPLTRDDVTELNRTAGQTRNLFLGDEELGVFEPLETGQRRLDALHLVEDGYIGHFSIRQVQGGSVCEAGVIRISKHEGLSHSRDTDYYGSVRITTSTNYGTWELQTGSGVLTNVGGPNDGQAIYTYVPGDEGTVVLRLVHDQVATVNVNVTNGIARDLASEDPNFSFDPELTLITWADEFNSVSFTNNDGTRNWVGAWSEIDGVDGTSGGGAGAGTGNIRVVDGRLRMTSSALAASNDIQPSLARLFNVDAVPYSEDVFLDIRYGHSALAASDSFVIEARGSSQANDSWVQVANFTNITSDQTNSSILVSYNLSTILGAQSQTFSSTSEIRFRINNGYELERFFFINSVVVRTATDQCGFSGTGTLEHYAISHDGVGIQCVGSAITITAHDAQHDPIDAGAETINLSVSPARGVWSRVLSGNGTLTSVANQSDNGQASYTFAPDEQSVTLLLNYTVPSDTPQNVNINVVGAISGAVELEDPLLQIVPAGLRFYNETLLDGSIPTQIAGKPSNVAPLNQLLTVQGVRSSDNNPFQCVPLFDAGQTLRIGLAAECKDPGTCIGSESFLVNELPITLASDNGDNGAAAYTEIDLNFITQPSGDTGATLVLNYSDVGRMQLHGRFNIPFGFFGGSLPDNPLSPLGLSGDFMIGSSPEFVVRPFGFAIDFPGAVGLDRAGNFPAGNFPDINNQSSNSFAADFNGSAWRVAGTGFDVLVTSMGWQAGDDLDQDGQPDAGANLHDNRPTPNFYYDTDGVANNYRVLLSLIENQAEAFGGVRGELSNNTLFYSNFNNSPVVGAGQVNVSYNEVGIIDLRAQLVDANETPVAYLGTAVINGRVNNLGRFYPQRFDVTENLLLPRVNASCTPESAFTYMDEGFGIELELRARNAQGVTTVNYRNGFAKLASYSMLNMRAIEEISGSNNTNRTNRLVNDTVPTNLQALWSTVTAGLLELNGTLIFARQMSEEPDGPFSDLIVAFVPIDSDGVTLDQLVLNAEITENEPEYFEIARHDFRYGRLIINNAYGPETEDLAITFRVEYYDGERFVTNTDDNCTVINASQLAFVVNTYTGDLDPGDTTIVAPQTTRFHQGQIQGVESAVSPADATMTSTASGEGNSGTVDVELDLDALSLPFLRYRWLHDDPNRATYDENPRAQLEFGQFRSHDRVIHWQEIYNGPSN